VLGTSQLTPRSLAVDADGNAYVGGTAYWPSLTLKNPIQSEYSNGFAAKVDAAGEIVYSTYVGGPVSDIAIDPGRNLYLTGDVGSNFVMVNAMQEVSSADAFVAKVNADGTAYVYSTPLGGDQADYGGGIAVDAAGDAYVVGETGGQFPTVAPFQPVPGAFPGFDAFVAKLGTADNIQFSRNEYLAMESEGQVEIAVMRSDATDMPVTVTYRTTNGTATAPFDYIATEGTLTFETGETRKTFTIPLVDDNLTDGSETILLSLDAPDPGSG